VEEEEEDDDDYNEDNEYLDEETVEQFEDRVLNKRAAMLHYRMRQRWQSDQPEIMFSSLAKKKDTYKLAAQKFYSLLVLQKYMAVDLHQSEIYGDLAVTKGPQFDVDTAEKDRR